MENRTCNKCGESKPQSEFYKNKRNKSGYFYQCKSCVDTHNREWMKVRPEIQSTYNADWRKKNKEAANAASRTWRAANPDKQALSDRNWRMKDPEATKFNDRKDNLKKRGLTIAKYDELVAAQGGRCAVCKCTSDKRLVVDHDHDCCGAKGGKSCELCRRGLLCDNCNKMLGFAKDSPEILQNAIDYIQHHKAIQGRNDSIISISDIRQSEPVPEGSSVLSAIA